LNQQISTPHPLRLDEYIRLLIQADGIDVVANHYIELREEYYQQRESGDVSSCMERNSYYV